MKLFNLRTGLYIYFIQILLFLTYKYGMSEYAKYLCFCPITRQIKDKLIKDNGLASITNLINNIKRKYLESTFV